MQLEPRDFAALDETQRMAVLDAMLIGLIADDKVMPAELRRFDEILLALPWGLDREVIGAMVKGAHERLRTIKTPTQVHDYVARLASKLPAPELRDKVVFTMATLMLSDGELDRLEKNVLGLFVVAFGITSDRAARIREALNLPAAPAAPPAPSQTN